jgi:hypothetical protein
MRDPERILFLAVPVDTFESFFQEQFIQEAVNLYKVKLIIYNPLQEVIVTWKE